MNVDAKINELLKDKADIERVCADAEAELQRLTANIAKYNEDIKAFDTIIAFYNEKASSSALSNGQSETVSPTFIDLEKSELKDSNVKDSLLNGNGGAKKAIKKRTAKGVRKGKPGFSKVGKDAFKDLPDIYTKRDVAILIMRKFPERKYINENTLRGIMIDYVNEGLAKVYEASSGRTLQKYQRLV